MKTFVGIDPGKSGAVVAINDKGITKLVIPTIGKEYDVDACIHILKSFKNPFVVLENINYHAAMGRQSAGVMGEGKMLWKALLPALEIPHALVTPQTWQKEMWEGVPPQYKTGKKRKTKDTKAMSLLAAKRLFPGVDLKSSIRSKVPHDGIVDALLIAGYAQRKFGK